ncbi:MAG: universal stress protein [Gammaproteobacteria bacterium]|nr:universal stress protein [Gammaproteobacteria bacterium]
MSECFLVGVDNSDCSRRAFNFACKRAESAGAKLVVVYVIEWSPYTFNTPEENEERHLRREEEIERANKCVLDPILKQINEAGIDGDGIVRHGNVTEVLSSLAAECGADQIIVGRIGESGLKSLLYGSVTTKLVQLSNVPVTVVP